MQIARCLAVLAVASVAAAVRGQDAFTFASDDRGNSLRIGGVLQTRYTANFRRDEAEAENDFTHGFSIRRVRLRFRGDAADGRVGFFFQTEGSGDDPMRLIDANLRFEPAEGVRFRLGTYRLNFTRELTVSARYLLAVDRSSASRAVNPTSSLRVRGVEMTLVDGDTTRGIFTFSDGTDALFDSFGSDEDGIAGTFRLEHAIIGGLRQHSQFTAPPGTPESLMVAGGVHFERREAGGDRFAWTADLNYQNDGFTASLIGIGHVAEDLNLGGDPEHAYGFIAQAGRYLTEKFEPFARYEYAAVPSGEPDLSLATVGANYYFAGQALRLAADVSYFFNDVSPLFDRTSDGYLRDEGGGDGQVLFRMQLQMLF